MAGIWKQALLACLEAPRERPLLPQRREKSRSEGRCANQNQSPPSSVTKQTCPNKARSDGATLVWEVHTPPILLPRQSGALHDRTLIYLSLTHPHTLQIFPDLVYPTLNPSCPSPDTAPQ